MKLLLTAINAKYIHSNLAVYSLRASAGSIRDQVELDAAGYVRADETTRTSVPGVFAVGDLRAKAVRQVVTAAADGAAAAHFAEEYLAGQA